MKALSIQEPFAYLIINGLKDKEHRKYGVILGSVELYDIEEYGNGVFAFLLRQPLKYFIPIHQKGKLGFFDIVSRKDIIEQEQVLFPDAK